MVVKLMQASVGRVGCHECPRRRPLDIIPSIPGKQVAPGQIIPHVDSEEYLLVTKRTPDLITAQVCDLDFASSFGSEDVPNERDTHGESEPCKILSKDTPKR